MSPNIHRQIPSPSPSRRPSYPGEHIIRTRTPSPGISKRRRPNPVIVTLAYLLFGFLFCAILIFLSFGWKRIREFLGMGSKNGSIIAKDSSSKCGFQTYRHPLHHEGLPRLVEVFHTEDSVYFGALNEGVCEPEWRGAQNFSSKNHFLCEFRDGTKVYSDPLPPNKPNDDVWTSAILIIRCSLPLHFRSSNELTVSLHATVDLEAGRWYGPTPGTDDPEWEYPSAASLGVFRDLHVCPREWSDTMLKSKMQQSRTTKGIQVSQVQTKKPMRTLSMVTQILMEYETFELKDRTRIRIPAVNIIMWIEYHLLIGFEHFYIFDNDQQQHGPLELLLEPYIEEGIVTYIWYPVQDCHRKSHDELDGSRITISQAMSSIMSLRRYEHETEFMGHFDVDEFIQLPSNVRSIKELVRTLPPDKSWFTLYQQWYHDCEQKRAELTALQHATTLLPLDRKFCVSPDTTPGKSIMRTKDVLGFFVHVPWVKTDHTLFDWDKDQSNVEGFSIAHVRGRRARDGIPIQIIGEPQHFVARPEWREELQAKVGQRMNFFHRERV